jgi:hypothetical protein
MPRDGHGIVYVLEDGFGTKIGYTDRPVAKRVLDLQTGNSRKITHDAEILDATPEVEAKLHSALNEWNVTGEWFARDRVIARAAAAGGFDPLLKTSSEWSTGESIFTHRIADPLALRRNFEYA